MIILSRVYGRKLVIERVFNSVGHINVGHTFKQE